MVSCTKFAMQPLATVTHPTPIMPPMVQLSEYRFINLRSALRPFLKKAFSNPVLMFLPMNRI